MGTKHGWLFPLMVLAASSVSVFGCIGIAAIMGYLPLTMPDPANPVTARALVQVPLAAGPAQMDKTPAPGTSEPARHE